MGWDVEKWFVDSESCVFIKSEWKGDQQSPEKQIGINCGRYDPRFDSNSFAPLVPSAPSSILIFCLYDSFPLSTLGANQGRHHRWFNASRVPEKVQPPSFRRGEYLCFQDSIDWIMSGLLCKGWKPFQVVPPTENCRRWIEVLDSIAQHVLVSFHVTSYFHNGFLVTASAPLLFIMVRLSSDMDETNMYQNRGMVPRHRVCVCAHWGYSRRPFDLALQYPQGPAKLANKALSLEAIALPAHEPPTHGSETPGAPYAFLPVDLQDGSHNKGTPSSSITFQKNFDLGESQLLVSTCRVRGRLMWRPFSGSDLVQT